VSPVLSLQTPIRTRERILTFGVGGVGKSNSILQIARKCPNRHFYIIDNDVSPSYNRALDTEFTDLKNVTVRETDPDDWEDGLTAAQELGPEVGYDDWLAFDSMTSPWDAVQSWFIGKLHGENDADYFMRVREEIEAFNSNAKAADKKKSANPFEGFMDWPAINKQYFLLTKALFKTRGHLYITAEQTTLTKSEADEIKGLFGPYGVKPKGQKKLTHQPHTILLLTKSRQGEYRITTIKDRSRAEVEEKPVVDFSKDYLRDIAGWKMEVVKDGE